MDLSCSNHIVRFASMCIINFIHSVPGTGLAQSGLAVDTLNPDRKEEVE